MKKITILLIACIAICYSSYAQEDGKPKNYPTIPTVDIKTVDGQTFSTKQIYNDGKPIIISLWATWCVPCREELDAISIVYDDWVEETGVQLYAISIDDSRSASRVAPYVNSKNWEYVVLQDINSDFKRAMNVTDVPFLCIVNGNGEIIWSHTSYAPGGENEVYEVLKELVK
ncbi:MAG: TlpA disulfide reductase family protein [Bacteroidales bacterium]|jgi:cytochrome c biogenesis protein CcmG, thiol:disulfide interchange protein DsbE|nr:TlpA family protein disulfide reductase [Bacteroidales bacterium]MDD4394341.1 TlpA disulfide reductase family protein [Bacteroidales bacterium]